MRAIYFDGSLRYRTDMPTPAPSPGEALIRTRLAGICNTDLEITRGYDVAMNLSMVVVDEVTLIGSRC